MRQLEVKIFISRQLVKQKNKMLRNVAPSFYSNIKMHMLSVLNNMKALIGKKLKQTRWFQIDHKTLMFATNYKQL